MTENKTKPTEASVDAYIQTLPNERKKDEAYEVLEMLKEITGFQPRMWGPSIIGFDEKAYKHGMMPKLAFSPRKARFVFYVINSTDQQNELLKKLGKYKTGKVCLYINKLADVEIPVLRELLEHAWKRSDNKNMERGT